MIFVTGPMFSGKRTYIQKKNGWTDKEMKEHAIWEVQQILSEDCSLHDLEQIHPGLADIARRFRTSQNGIEQMAETENHSGADRFSIGLEDEFPLAELAELAEILSEYPVVIATETGCGVVPMKAEDRKFRENAGRLSCLLAGKAEKVIRMCCGIAQIIK